MFSKFITNRIIEIYTKKFYLFSCIANIISSIFAFFIIPGIGSYLSVFGIIMFVSMLIEGIHTPKFTKEQYNDRYVIKIIYEIIITFISCILMSQQFLMYLPILLSMLYMNVNTAIKSKLLYYASIIFMFTPLIKIYSMQSQDILTYISVCVLFMLVSILSTFLFRSNLEMVKDSENRIEILKEIYKLTHRHVNHDINNELTRLYILSYKQHQAPGDYMEILKECSENIQRYSKTDIFGYGEKIDLEYLIKDLDKYTSNCEINYCNSFIDRKEIISNRNLIYAILVSILENCILKSRKNNIIGDVTLIKRENVLIILDECGVDVSKALKKLLNVIQDPSIETIFKFKFTANEISNGLEYRIIFTNYEK